MTQILITGMHRSGTTLLADLVRSHPGVHKVFHESVLMKLSREELLSARRLPDYRMIQTRGEVSRARNVEPYEWPVDCDLGTTCWAAKMSYPGPVILQEWMDRTDAYIRRWLDCFDQDARVLHVIRHPFDVFVSARRRWQADPGHIANYGPVSLDVICRDWVHAVEAVESILASDPRSLSVRYETLLESPEKTLTDIYLHCGLAAAEDSARATVSGDVVFFGEVDATRAHRHRDERLEPISRATACLLREPFARFGYGSA